MKISMITVIMVCLSVSFPGSACAETPKMPHDILSYLPSDMEAWQTDGNPSRAEGEEQLFRIINGGAEIFLKCGFRQAMMQAYENKNSRRINLEIFEMKTPAAASRVYKHKAGGEGKKTDIGTEAMLADYYLIFREGRFYVSLTGFDSETETVNGLIRIAKKVEENLRKPIR